MEDLELKVGNSTCLRVSAPDKDDEFEIEIDDDFDLKYCYINKEQATQLRDFLNQYLDEK